MALIKMDFRELENGFFLHNVGGGKKLFFALAHGKYSFPFPVCDDRIQQEGDVPLYSGQEIEVIPREDWDQFGLNEQMVREFIGQ